MQTWMISADGKKYDHAAAFQEWGFIDWKQNNIKYSIGDIVYIYCAKPIKRLMYKTVVKEVNLTKENIVNDLKYWHNKVDYYKSLEGYFVRLYLLEQTDTERLSYEKLIKHGLNVAPQKALKVSETLAEYINSNMDDFRDDAIFPDSAIENDMYEGAKKVVVVNKYERSSIARQRCIEANGTKCFVCGFDFEKEYGEIGKGFIHVHHVVPLNEIGENYKVDYKKDLIPVCPNCHAMLHRKKDGGAYTWQELKRIREMHK